MRELLLCKGILCRIYKTIEETFSTPQHNKKLYSEAVFYLNEFLFRSKIYFNRNLNILLSEYRVSKVENSAFLGPRHTKRFLHTILR